MSCLDDDLVLGLVEGRLAAPALAVVDEHLDGCESCRDVIAQVARSRSPARVLERGHTVGRYVIGDLLGSGAMGRVYSAWEPELDRRVAIKVLVAEGEGARDRVVREAQAMAKLDHPNVVGVHEVGTSSDGVYVAMELVEGETLRAWVQRVPGANQHSWRDVVGALVEVARGLAAVHAAGVVHRDIKPDNVIVGRDGRVRLGDFGLARTGASPSLPGGDTLATGTPQTGIAGTPAYMAPEVLRGGAASAASDQFSFGVLAYEALAGTRPFTGATWAELLTSIDRGAIAPLRGVPAWLDAAIGRCLDRDPARRFPSLRAIADHLADRAARKSPARWVAAAIGAAAVASGITWIASRESPAAAATCESGGDEIAAVWSATRRAKLATLGPGVVAILDRWTATWARERDATCVAARVEPATTIAARSRCLDQRRTELGLLIGEIAGSPRDGIPDALGALPHPSECRAVAAGAADARPLDPARARFVADVEAALPAIRVANALGDSRPVVTAAANAVDNARASGHAPTLGEALLVQAETLRGASDLAAAHVAAREAVAAAERGHDDLLAARAWIARVATAGDRRDLAAAEDAGSIAAAAIDRAGAPPHLAATLVRLRGLVAYNRGDNARANELLTDARRRAIELAGAESLEVAAVEGALGAVARATGDLTAAERWHRSALAIDRALRGDRHPDVALDLHSIAGVLRLRGDLVAAEATYREALAIEEATRGPRSFEAALTRNSLGLVAMARRDWARARDELALSLELFIAAGHGDRAFAHHNLGIVAAARGEHHQAIAHYQHAAEVYASTIGPGAAPSIRLLLDRARSELRIDDPRGYEHARRARDAAHAAGIRWIEDDATVLLAAKKPAPTVVLHPVDPPSRDTPPAVAEPKPVPAPPAPDVGVRDVGVYGSAPRF